MTAVADRRQVIGHGRLCGALVESGDGRELRCWSCVRGAVVAVASPVALRGADRQCQRCAGLVEVA